MSKLISADFFDGIDRLSKIIKEIDLLSNHPAIIKAKQEDELEFAIFDLKDVYKALVNYKGVDDDG